MNRQAIRRLALLATGLLVVAVCTLTGCSGALDDADYAGTTVAPKNSSAG